MRVSRGCLRDCAIIGGLNIPRLGCSPVVPEIPRKCVHVERDRDTRFTSLSKFPI